ncbi:MAG TPA: hypothetical protein VFX17_00055 [Patescibacteria group bacterium]|nr:hypothetical protein [Patescibacteria group bacterium]
MWTEVLKFVGSIVGGSAVLITAFTYLSKRLIDHQFTKEIEKFKSDLVIAANRDSTTYKELHARRADVIHQLYKKITRTYRAYESLINPMQFFSELSPDEKKKIASDAYKDLFQYFDERRIYFKEEIENKIDRFTSDIININNEFIMKDFVSVTKIEKWNKVWIRLKEETPKIQKEIKDEFRLIMGIN